MAKSHIFAVIGPTMIVSLPGFGVASMIGGVGHLALPHPTR